MRLAIVCCLLLSTPALAQSAPDPCAHGQSTVSMGGADIDSMRCELAVSHDAIGQQAAALVNAEASLRMARSDLAAAQAKIAELTKQLAEKVKPK